MKERTFVCECGHLAYYIPRRGWCCMCQNPRKRPTLDDYFANLRAQARKKVVDKQTMT